MKVLNEDGQKEGEYINLNEKQTSKRKYWGAEGSEGCSMGIGKES